MAYADPLDETLPAGNRKRKLGDDDIRQHIRAIRQRFASIFVNVDSDPLVLKDGSVNSGQIANNAVISSKIAALQVLTAAIDNLAVTTAKLADASITPAKIAAAGDFLFPALVDAATGYKVGGAGGAIGQVLRSDGAKAVFSAIQPGDLPASADGAQVWQSGNIDLGNGVLTAIDFDQEDWDSGGVHDGVNPSRLTCPVDGRYLILAGISFAGVAADVFITLRKNVDATDLDRADLHTVGSSVGNLRIATIQQLVAGDYVRVFAQTNVAANPDIIGGRAYTHFSMVRQT